LSSGLAELEEVHDALQLRRASKTRAPLMHEMAVQLDTQLQWHWKLLLLEGHCNLGVVWPYPPCLGQAESDAELV